MWSDYWIDAEAAAGHECECVMRVSDFPTEFHQSFLPADKTLVDTHERKD